MWNYQFEVPKSKQVRLIVYTDCKNEADDQFALAHALMTPKVDVVGIIAAHFETAAAFGRMESGTTASASMEEIHQVLKLMGLKAEDYKLALGSELPLSDAATPQVSAAAQMIVDEAMREDDRPLYIGCQGSVTDLASAILMKPEICGRMTAIWIGGGDYPKGGQEFNLLQDIHAANVLFGSEMPLWQVPMSVYKTFAVSLAELQLKVAPCGEIGKYLFEYMVEFNKSLADIPHWPHGEIWGLGDQGVIAALMQEGERTDNSHMIPAPQVDPETMNYILDTDNREIRVFDYMDVRLTLEDFYAKLALNYGGARE